MDGEVEVGGEACATIVTQVIGWHSLFRRKHATWPFFIAAAVY
jgi:hypothetical protein